MGKTYTWDYCASKSDFTNSRRPRAMELIEGLFGLRHSVLELIHKKLETDLGNQRAYLDAIYYCPHHPDKGYPEERQEYKIECECRKPKPGMLLQAAKEFNINLNESWMIGDSERDIIAGKNAGCKTIGVKTGYGVAKASLKPDYFFANLSEAVDFILKDG